MRGLIQATVKAAPAPEPRASVRKQPPRPVTDRAIPEAIYADLLGKPYEADARGPEAYDCLGLALVIARRLGKQVPDFVSSEETLHAQLGTGGTTLADCPQIARPEPGCVALLRISPSEHHLAFMVDEFRMIHTLRDVGCAIERINSNLWHRKVIGFYRLSVETVSERGVNPL
jgi:hypothetical protein